QSYDRQLTDIFSVEAEVAKSIAGSLQAALSPQEKARVEIKPTDNADAYVLYLRGRDYQTRPDNLLQDFRSAANLYEQAITLFPMMVTSASTPPQCNAARAILRKRLPATNTPKQLTRATPSCSTMPRKLISVCATGGLQQKEWTEYSRFSPIPSM